MRTGILLANQFIMLNLDLVIDTLRIANRVLDAAHFQWQVFTVDNQPAVSCNGYVVQPAGSWAESAPLDCILVITGFEPEQSLRAPVLDWLCAQHQAGVVMGCMDTGAFALAAAGVLPATPVAIHWEFGALFQQQYPEIKITTGGIACSERFFSASGGLSVADMMLRLLEQCITPAQLKEVTHILYCHGSPLPVASEHPATQRLNQVERAEAYMQTTLAHPLSLAQLAGMVNMHPRTFSRQFQQRYDTTPMQHYRQLRLNHARTLLLQTRWPIGKIAELCGFSEASNFSLCFTRHYRQSPQAVRKQGLP